MLTLCILSVAARNGTGVPMDSALAKPLTEEMAIGNPVYQSNEHCIGT